MKLVGAKLLFSAFRFSELAGEVDQLQKGLNMVREELRLFAEADLDEVSSIFRVWIKFWCRAK